MWRGPGKYPVCFAVFLLLAFACSGSTRAGERRGPPLSRPEVRAAVVARRKAEAGARKAEAVAFARAAGLPVRGRIGNRTYELMAVRNGRPLYYVTHNANAAISTAADRIRNTSPYNLNGAGLTVGVWDGGWIREAHQEFGGRATIMDTGGALNSHSTHVGGTIGAGGVDPLAEGMAPSVSLDSYEWNSDYAEMTSRGASYAGEAGKIYVSNHSYGFLAGWEWGTWSGGQARYHWVGAPWPVDPGSKYDDFFGRYEDEAVLVDQVAFDCPYYLIFNSAGNDRSDNPEDDYGTEYDIKIAYWNVNHWTKVWHDVAVHPEGDGLYKGGYDTLTGWAVAKNVMTVGSVTDAVSGAPLSRDPSASTVNSFSCWGPTDDGRIKPDVVANGDNLYSSIATGDTAYDGTYSGTSMSSPGACGSAILLVEYYADLFAGDAMRASTLKALIIHTADDMGNTGPDYSYGWGLMNAEAAATLVKNYADLPAGTRIIEGTLTAANPSDSYTVTWDGTYPIRATLSWTDPPGTATTVHDDTTPNLVNDLDLVVTGPPPGSTTFWPYALDPANPSNNATTAENNVDNVEQVHVAAPPAAGDYTVTVDFDGTLTGGEQYYSLIITGGPKPPPTVSAVTPNTSGRVVVAVEVTGDDFQPGAEVRLSKAAEADIEATSEQVTIASIQCTFDLAGAAFGDWDVVVTNPDGQSATLAAGFTVLTSIDITAVTPASGTVSKYAKVELLVSISNIVATELYDPDPAYGGLDLSATFTAPDGLTTWDIDGFYDGSDWRVRFAPDTEGDWTFEVAAADPSGTDAWTGGTFTCVISTDPGWLRINGSYLEFCEGGTFFGVGHNNGWQYEVEEPTIADMAVRGENLLSFWMATPWDTPSTAPARAPIENVDQGIGNYNQAACTYMDYLVGEAETEGVYLLPTVWAHDQLCDTMAGWPQSWDNNAYNTLGISAADFYTTKSGAVDTEQWRRQKNFYRYLVARWGYSTAVAGWVLVAEIDGTDGYVFNNAEMNTWLISVRDYFAAGDPYRVNGSNQYPMAVSKVDIVSGDALTWDSGHGLHAADSYQSSTDDVGVADTIASQTIAMRGSGRPSFHSEFGGDTSSGATQPAHLHNGIWAGTAAGAAMTPLVWCDGGGWPMLTDPVVGEDMRQQLEYLSEFMAQVTCLGEPGLVDALPAIKDPSEVVDPNYQAWGMKVADRGYAWILNTADTISGTGADARTFTVTGLTSGAYDVDWYDVWTSGNTPLPASGSVNVAADGILTADIPELAEADIACRFVRSGPTYVLMGDTSVRSVGVGALLQWTTESEVDNLGFHVLRRPAAGGKWTRVTASLVPGRLTAVGAEDYAYLDLCEPGRYEYRLETVSTGGVTKPTRPGRGSRGTMTVTVSPEHFGPSLVEAALETPGLFPALIRERAADAYGRWRARVQAGARARPAPCRVRPRRSVQEGRGECPRLLASTAGLLQDASGVAAAARPRNGLAFQASPGDVRVRTRGDGVFFVPAAELPCAPEHAALITGGVRSRPLEADASGIWFFAADHRDDYTDVNATFVTAGRGAPNATRALSVPRCIFSREALTTAAAVARAEEDTRFLVGAEGAPNPWFYSALLKSGQSEQTVSVDVAGLAGGQAVLRVAVFGYTHDGEIDPDHEIAVSVNGVAVADLTWDGRGYVVLEVPLPGGTIMEGANTIGLLLPETEAIPHGHGAALDYVEVEYRESFSVASGPVILEVDRPGVVEIAGLADAELWVVEVGDTGRGRGIGAAFRSAEPGPQATTSCLARFQVRSGIYYVATPDQVRTPVDVSGAVVVSAPGRADYLAVGPERLRWSTEPLLDARRDDGLVPVYMSLESVVDTYGFGRYGAAAVTRLVRELRPRYVLLVGDNSYDYLDRLGTGVDPMVPAVLTRTAGLSQANADALYGDLDGDGTPEVPVGRLPVRTADELDRVVSKIVERAAACRLRGVLVADVADDATNFAAAQDAVAQSFPDVDWERLYAGVHGDAVCIRERLTETVNSGADLVIYQGHGSSGRLGRRGGVLDVTEAARWTGSPLVYLSTCWGAYIQKTTEAPVSMAEVMLRSETGPAGVIGSTAACSQRSQAVLLHGFLRAALGEGRRQERPGPSGTGDALVSAQRAAAEVAQSASTEEERSAILDAMRCYTVLGDPAMPLVLDGLDDVPDDIPQDAP